MKYVTEVHDPIQVACNIADLADYLSVDQSDSVLYLVAMDATSQAVEYLQCDLINRRRTVTYNEWPFRGTYTPRSMSPQSVEPCYSFELPYANLQEVESVEIYGEPFTADQYRVEAGKPTRIYTNPVFDAKGRTSPAIVCDYVAGFGPSVSSVPYQIQVSIMKLAAFLYEHRGSCDAHEAMLRSGASSTLNPFRFKLVAL